MINTCKLYFAEFILMIEYYLIFDDFTTFISNLRSILSVNICFYTLFNEAWKIVNEVYNTLYIYLFYTATRTFSLYQWKLERTKLITYNYYLSWSWLLYKSSNKKLMPYVIIVHRYTAPVPGSQV